MCPGSGAKGLGVETNNAQSSKVEALLKSTFDDLARKIRFFLGGGGGGLGPQRAGGESSVKVSTKRGGSYLFASYSREGHHLF